MPNQVLEGFRLSPQQKHLWSLQQKGCIYCTQGAISMKGNLNVEVLRAALQKVVDRHEILRTNFHYQPGIKFPIQVIRDTSRVSWDSMNLSVCNPQEQSVKIDDLFQEERRHNFNYQQGSLLRLFLIKLTEQQHILLITLPSLCADSWTLKNLLKELSQTYSLCLQGEELWDEPIQYIQFSEWQNELIEGEDADIGLTYWQSQELALQQPISLPFENEAYEKKQFSTNTYALNISQDLIEKIEKISKEYQNHISDFFLACWEILIWKLTKQSDIVIESLFSGRKYEELEETLGLLAKWLPVCSPINSEFKFFEILSQLNKNLRQAEKYQEYFPIQDYTDVNKTYADLPLSFEFEELPEEYHSGGVTFSLYKRYVCFQEFKVKLSCLWQKGACLAEFRYNSNIFSHDNIQRLAKQFLTLVESATTNPKATVGELEILNNKERHQLLVELNNSKRHYPQDKCIHQLFEQQVEQTPNNIAVVFENQQLTYAQLNTRANQLAHYLKQLGVGSEVLVGLCVERSLDVIVGLLGILKAGGAYLPLDPALPKEGLETRLQDAQASLVISHSSLIHSFEQMTNDKGQMTVICLDTDWKDIALESQNNPQTAVQPENLAYVIFTSGSTGKPKGVAVEHRQLVNYLFAIVERLNLPIGASFATVSTIAADLGNTAIFPALCTGGCLHIISQERVADSQALEDYFHHHPIDYLKIVPSHLTALLTSSSSQSILPQRCLVLGGETASWDLIKNVKHYAPNCEIVNHYGPTETTVGVLTYAVQPDNELPQNRVSKTVPLGRPLGNVQVYVLDERLQLVPIGVPGELYIGGVALARGYLNRPEEQAHRFISNPFEVEYETRLYKTGDIVRYLPDGNLEFLGRVDHQVKIRGFRVELGEIEATLREHPGVQEVVVSVREEVLGDKRLIAYIIPNSKFRSQTQHTTLTSELRSFSLKKLPEYMVPSAFVLLKTLPLTPNGKVDRNALPTPEQSRPELEKLYVAPRTSVETQIAEIWAKVLGLERVGIYNNFFELGGHSLLITQLLAQIRKAFQVDLSLNALFEVPTIAALAQRIDTTQQTEPSTDSETLAKLLADAVLDPAICLNNLTYNPSVSESAIFLTGATGFLGAFLLYELLQQTKADIYCLVRSNNIESAKTKIQNNLESYLIWDESNSQRIIPVIGDLSQSLFGLSQEQFQELASRIDVIYHNGAAVNFTYPYPALKAPNVLGTHEVLRLASQIKVKPVHFVSTIGVVSSVYSSAEVIREEDSIDGDKTPSGGYTQSKWVAEKLLTIARERGFPVSIYRPGRISGSSQTGVCNTGDHTFRMIKGCIQLGMVPDRDTTVNISPVDYVSKAIVHLSRQQESLSKTFHLINPNPVLWSEVFNYIRSFGYPLIQIPEEKWRAKLLNTEDAEENALYPLISIFQTTGDGVRAKAKFKLDCQNTLDGLAGTSIICPPVNKQLFEVYFSHLIHSGFLEAPIH